MNGKFDFKLDFVNENESSKTIRTFDINKFNRLKKRVRPVDLQEDNESRNLWKEVIQALQKSDYEQAHSSRCTIEKQQRLTDKLRKEKNFSFLSKNFTKTKIYNSSSSTNLGSKISTDCDNMELGYRWYHKNWSL